MNSQKEMSIYGFFGAKPKKYEPITQSIGVPLLDNENQQYGLIFGDFEQLHMAGETSFDETQLCISWDPSSQTICFKREYTGIETLFYLQDKQTMFFSSSLKELLILTSHISKKVFFNSLVDLALLGRIAAPYTLYEGIKHLCPGKKQVHQFINQTLTFSETNLSFNSKNSDKLVSNFITGNAAETFCNPYASEVSNNNLITNLIENLANKTNIEMFKELPHVNSVVFEPIADMGTLIYAQSLKHSISNTHWNVIADLLNDKSVLDQRLTYLKSIVRQPYKNEFEQYWLEERRPELLKNASYIKAVYSDLPSKTLSEDSLIRLSAVMPERLRNMKNLLSFYLPNEVFNLERIDKNELVKSAKGAYLRQSFFSDEAIEAGNLFSQFSNFDRIGSVLDGRKFTTFLSLSLLEKRKKLNTISQSDSIDLERCLCGFVNADFLWRFYS